MEGPKFDYGSTRAREARLARRLGGSKVYGLAVFGGWLLIACGILAVWLLGAPWGWFVAGLSGLLWLLAGLSRMLRQIPPGKGDSLDQILHAEVLGVLPENHSPRQLAGVVAKLMGGRFFAARFGIGGKTLEQIVSDNPADSALVWSEANRLRMSLSQPMIDSATLAAALIRTLPLADQLLAQLRLTTDDITAGLAWYQQVQEVIAEHGQKRPDGGLGRDWAFGYTPLLDQFGRNISQQIAANAPSQKGLESRRVIMSQMINLLSNPGRRNATLIGGLGSGKTTMVHALAKKLMQGDSSVPEALRFRQIVVLNPSALIAQAPGRGELEGLVQNLFYEAVSAKNIILFLDDAQLFFEDGHGAVNLSNVLLPVLDSGALPLILAMDEQRWLGISQVNPELAQSLNRIIVQPMDEHETMLVMQDQFMIYEYQKSAVYTYQSLQAAYRLSSRFMGGQVMPGRALKLLEMAAQTADDGLVTDRSVEAAIEQTQGIKVGSASSQDEREKLLNLEQLIHQRMINQTRAVQVVSDALRRARAGVRNEKRPIGTFLFLGPTGVGKTELAKSVAAVFFGGEDNLVRVDLNEYVQSNDVARLIADGAQDSHSLTAQISKKPFSVVLLDEIEKAHPNVLNTLLQMLDEGILRDINNREVSFRDAVVIATSNAGAEQIRQHIEAGEQLEQFEAQFVNELIDANIFRPEFLNRFDETVLFRPLTQDELVRVADIIIQNVNKTLAAQKLSVVLDDSAKRLLAAHGYDPRLGARPLRRVVQRAVENAVSNRILQGQAMPGSQIYISAEEVQSMLERSSVS